MSPAKRQPPRRAGAEPSVTLRAALDHHRAGRLDAAEAGYERVLADQPVASTPATRKPNRSMGVRYRSWKRSWDPATQMWQKRLSFMPPLCKCSAARPRRTSFTLERKRFLTGVSKETKRTEFPVRVTGRPCTPIGDRAIHSTVPCAVMTKTVGELQILISSEAAIHFGL